MSLITENVTSVGMWPTPIGLFDLTESDQWRAMNDELLGLVLDQEARDQDPMTFGVMGATKTSHAIMRWDVEPIHWLKRRIVDSLRVVAESVGAVEDDSPVHSVIDGWVVVYREAASHRLHTHHGSAWSGVYYLSTGDLAEDAGHLQFLDPRVGAIARGESAGVAYIDPRPGRLVLFPSWLAHSVKATGSLSRERVCIAFNIGYKLRADEGTQR